MSWFSIALIGPVLYSIANHTDKYVISKYLKNGQVGALIVFSALFSLIAVPIVLFIHPQVFTVSLVQAIALGINAILVVIAVLLYFYALSLDEVSVVVPFYQTIPIFGFILSYFILGETITLIQTCASIIVILGALALSFDLRRKKIRFKTSVVALMLTASLLYAVNSVIFKFIALQDGFWPSTFWGFVGKGVLGLLFLLYVPYRKQFLKLIKTNRLTIMGLTSMSEGVFIIAESVMQYATLLAPVTLVLLVNAFQPVFVLLIGVILTIIFPKIERESLREKQLLQKIIGIGLIVIGSYFAGV